MTLFEHILIEGRVDDFKNLLKTTENDLKNKNEDFLIVDKNLKNANEQITELKKKLQNVKSLKLKIY